MAKAHEGAATGVNGGRRERISFSKTPDMMELPSLVEIQTESYGRFLQPNLRPNLREEKGLQAVFNEVFPVTSTDKSAVLHFEGYSLSTPKYTVEECAKRGITFAAALKARVRLDRYEDGRDEEPKMLSQDVYFGEMPLMTSRGTFVINGAERVIVSQLHKSPGVAFEEKPHPSGRKLLSARIIPYRGAWLEFEFDTNDVLFMLIDRRAKLPATAILRALGYETDRDILELFYNSIKVRLTLKTATIDGSRKKPDELLGKRLAQDIVDESTGEVLWSLGDAISKEVLEGIHAAKISEFEIIGAKGSWEEYSIANTLKVDVHKSSAEAFVDIYRRLRPGDPATVKTAQNMFERYFFDPNRYDLADVGRYKINQKLKLDIPMEKRTLTKEDVVETLRYLVQLKSGNGTLEDIDHLGNRRVRSVGELLSNQIRIGLVRMERTVLERMNFQDMSTATPQTLVNPKPVSAAIKDFFGRSQLSHFMDQANPLAELTHKRRLSALGPGGLSRERAGFEVRDVHPSHYGRICPIETPEGPNIGLMVSLSTYARVNEFGFIETPYRKAAKGRVTGDVQYLAAYEEDNFVIAQANAALDEDGRFTAPEVLCRCRGDIQKVEPEKVDFMDVSPKQLVSVAAALIPFLEHDDANRALMGSNMQRQAVPLIRTEAPVVGTAMEGVTAKNSGSVVVAEHSGTVEYADSQRIRVRRDETNLDPLNPFEGVVDEYPLQKFVRSNQNTCINQRPIIELGDRVEAGNVIADGPATDQGELALGRNILVAFMPWEGYNFEDAILISERAVREDMFSSIHLEVFEIDARDTKLGKEEVTRDIPNVGEEALANLGEDGIVRIGAKVRPGDILVGKVTPKGETELAPEEKLLRAIFGEKAEDVKDASLVASPGIEGVVVGVQVFSRSDKSQSRKTKAALDAQVKEIVDNFEFEAGQVNEKCMQALKKIAAGRTLAEDLMIDLAEDLTIDKEKSKIQVAAGSRLRVSDFDDVWFEDLLELKLSFAESQEQLDRLFDVALLEIEKLRQQRDAAVDALKKGDELPAGVNKSVKVYVARRRKLNVGDKMAGRHGNKGVIAKILPEEDMPYLPDGTPVDLVLNPLGVPSRMNVGQILETHLGWAGMKLNVLFASPVFNGATESEIREQLEKAGLPSSGKIRLTDGRTGQLFDQEITVGHIYMMKLSHLVDEKIHARAIGPYSLVTQQPLGGKAQSGGQRCGEMEVWALEAYGAAHTLQELLTIKSDDVAGRTKAYETIVKGGKELEAGTPESFNVLVKELQSLCLDVQKLKKVEDSRQQGIDVGEPMLMTDEEVPVEPQGE